MKLKPPDPPISTAKRLPDEPNGCGNHADRSIVCMDTYSVGNDVGMAENETKNVRTSQIDPKTQNSPYAPENRTPERTSRWRRVSVGDGDVYVPPIALIGTTSRNFVFGRVESGDEAIAPSVEGGKAGAGDGDRNGDDGDVDDMTSGSNVDSS